MEEDNKNVEENIQQPVETPVVEEPKEKKPKNNKPLLIVVLIIFMGFIFGCGMYLGKQLYENNNNSSKKSSNTETTNTKTNTEVSNNDVIAMDINDPVVQQLFKTFNYNGSSYYLFGEKLNTYNTVRLELAYWRLDSSDIKERSCSDLKPYMDDKGRYCGDMTNEMEKYYANYPENDEPFKEATKKNTTTYIEENSLISKYNELFSSNYPYKAEDFWMMVYYNDKSLYAYYGCQCGGTYDDTITHTINSAYKIDDKLYLETVYNSIDENEYNVKYEFILENGNYKFLKVTESKINN